MTASDEYPAADQAGSTGQVAPPAPNLRRLWAIVIGLGALIVIGVAVMVTMLVMGAGSKRGGNAGTDAAGDIRMLDIPVAAGTVVSQINSDGSRITMVVRGPEGDEVILLDATKGTVVMRARLVPR